MPKLHQILAVETGIRAQTQRDLTDSHHGLQKPDMLQGIYREYQPVAEGGEKLPPERQLLQTRVPEVVKRTMEILERTFDIIAVRDFANCEAKADVILNDGTALLKNVPATYLLWVEKRLEDLHAFVSRLPILPADLEWVWDTNQMCYRNKQEIKTVRTAKIPYSLVLLAPTKEHQGQAVEKSRDEIVGHWTTIRYSGALPVELVRRMKDRVEELQKVVKYAREKANEIETKDVKVGETVLKYVFGNLA